MSKNKKKLAEYFLTDARDFVDRYNKLKESATHIGLRTKLVIDLMFSLECALKSLFILETDLPDKEAYKKLKSLSHDIKKIANELSIESQAKFNKMVKIEYYSICKVHQRYMLESEKVFRGEFGALGEKYYQTINDHRWRESFADQIKTFIEYVETKNPHELKTISFSEIDIKKTISDFKSLKEI